MANKHSDFSGLQFCKLKIGFKKLNRDSKGWIGSCQLSQYLSLLFINC